MQSASPSAATPACINTSREGGHSNERSQTYPSAEANCPRSRAWLVARRDDDCLIGLVDGNRPTCRCIQRGRCYKFRTRRHSHQNNAQRPGQDGTAPGAEFCGRFIEYNGVSDRHDGRCGRHWPWRCYGGQLDRRWCQSGGACAELCGLSDTSGSTPDNRSGGYVPAAMVHFDRRHGQSEDHHRARHRGGLDRPRLAPFDDTGLHEVQYLGSTMTRIRHHAEKGFSLLELMASTVLMMVVAGGAFRALNYYQKTYQRTEISAHMPDNLRSATHRRTQYRRQRGAFPDPTSIPTAAAPVASSPLAQPVVLLHAANAPIYVNENLLVDAGASQQTVVVTQAASVTFKAVFG